MPNLKLGAGTLALAATVLAGAAAARADDLKAVGTDGSATLTMCRNWLIYNDCRDYNHVTVPARIAVGDTLGLDFGSNPKEYEFPVVRIVYEGGRCTLYSEATGDPQGINRLIVEPCSDRSTVP